MRSVVALFALASLALVADASAESTHPAMTDPSKATTPAPATFRAKFETTKGTVVFECTRDWAPNGVDRFYNLVRIGFFDDVALFRVAKGFVVQWGIHGNPKVSAVWSDANIPPDPPKQSNTRGMLTYAMAGSPTTRSTQLFINYGNNASLDAQGFAPLCKVVLGMEIADAFNGEYGERVTGMQGKIQSQGNTYLKASWPNLDYIKTATIEGDASPHGSTDGSKPADEKVEERSSNTLFYLVGGFAVAAALAWFFTKKSDEARKKSGAPTTSKAGLTNSDAARKKKKKKRP